jgi:hypothetical protein
MLPVEKLNHLIPLDIGILQWYLYDYLLGVVGYGPSAMIPKYLETYLFPCFLTLHSMDQPYIIKVFLKFFLFFINNNYCYTVLKMHIII